MGKDKPWLSSRSQGELGESRAQQSADPLLGKPFCTGGDTGRGGHFLILLIATCPAQMGWGGSLGLLLTSARARSRIRGSCSVSGAARGVGTLGRDPVASRAPGDSPPPPLPTGLGGDGCSVGSQSGDQYYKAHPLEGEGEVEVGGENSKLLSVFTEPSRARPAWPNNCLKADQLRGRPPPAPAPAVNMAPARERSTFLGVQSRNLLPEGHTGRRARWLPHRAGEGDWSPRSPPPCPAATPPRTTERPGARGRPPQPEVPRLGFFPRVSLSPCVRE